MDTDNNLRIPWKIKRDITKRGYTLDKIIAQLKDREDDFKKYIHPQKATADIIINFYTDTIFDITTFDINADLKILLKVGIRKKYNITNIVNNQKINKIDSCDDYMYLSFKQNINYNGVLNSIISTINT
jgi:uridine kinase